MGKSDRIDLSFTEVGVCVRRSLPLYDRGQTATARIQPGEAGWKSIFARSVCWPHTGGICTALISRQR